MSTPQATVRPADAADRPAHVQQLPDTASSTPRLNGFWKIVVAVFTAAGILLAVNQAFFLNLGGVTLLTNQYLYFILAAFFPLVFIIFPARKKSKDAGRDELGEAKGSHARVPWYDALLALAVFIIAVTFGISGERILLRGWDYVAPTWATVFAFLLWALVLEGLRRTAGLVVMLIALVFSLYPLFAAFVPVSFLQGSPYPLPTTAQIHVMGVDSIMGLPLQTAGSILIGFLLFGVALQHSGGAQFFYELATSLFGRFRGGSAKVSVVSSAAMGMMSGSAVSNVLTTGPMTIPAMKKDGFPGRYAAGIEATAATGGTITPPIMGAAAFLMVSFVGVPYAQIAIAATIPAVLYYWGIFLQVDGYSARSGLRGMPLNLIPHAGKTVLSGGVYMAALIGLLLILVFGKSEAQAPYWVVLFLLVSMLFMPRFRLTPRSLLNFIIDSGKTIAEIIGIIAGVGLIVGGLSMTGVSLSLARELVNIVGDNVFLVLIAGAVTSFVLGMGMTVSAVYVFLAIVMAPALVGMGINPIAAHLFVIYWATVSYITPPVALASFAAANIAGTPPMSTALTAMRLGAVKYIVPFAFALNPALVAQAAWNDILLSLLAAFVGVYFLASAFEGFVTVANRTAGIIVRVLLLAGGLAMLWPNPLIIGLGLAVGIVASIIARLTGKPSNPAPAQASAPAPAAAQANTAAAQADAQAAAAEEQTMSARAQTPAAEEN